jgi:hypothetical protein
MIHILEARAIRPLDAATTEVCRIILTEQVPKHSEICASAEWPNNRPGCTAVQFRMNLEEDDAMNHRPYGYLVRALNELAFR